MSELRPAPFRWDIARREQLGGLVEGELAPVYDGFEVDLAQCAARVIAESAGSDIVFVGRSPEHLFDYLSGIFATVPDAIRLQLLHYSNRWVPPDRLVADDARAVRHLFAYFEAEAFDPASIATRPRPVTLCDLVSEGGTFENLIKLMHRFAGLQGADWNAVQRRLGIVGVTTRGKNSPNAFRWQQHQDWLDLVPDVSIRNVSAPAEFCWFCAGDNPKVTRSFDATKWASEAARFPLRGKDHLKALRLAVRLYDLGNSRNGRDAFVSLLTAMPDMRKPQLRSLVQELRMTGSG